MRKINMKVLQQEDQTIIAKTLLNIFIEYNPYKRSDHNYIKINICKGVTIIIKMLNPFPNGSSSVILTYVTNGDTERNKCIFSQAIQYDLEPEMVYSLYSVAAEAIAKSIGSLIFNCNLDVDEVYLSHNLDEEEPMRLFEEVMRIKYTKDEDKMVDGICEMFGYVMSHLNKIDDCMQINLYYNINIGDPEEISSVFKLRIQYTEIFGQNIYNFSVIYPGIDSQCAYGLQAGEAEEYIKNCLLEFLKIAGYTLDSETAIIALYKQKGESNYV